MKDHPLKPMAAWLFLILIFPPVQVTSQAIRKPYLQIPTPGTKYDYSVDGKSKGTEEQYFTTNPEAGARTPVRIRVISDFGQTNSDQTDERPEAVARWKSFNNDDYHASFVLSLGDQSQDDSRYQLQHNYFNQLENVLINTPLFTAIGNHDNHDGMENYLSTFALPANAEAGGIVSGTEKYYSFDYANIHVVVLCTEIEAGSEWSGQVEWLQAKILSFIQSFRYITMDMSTRGHWWSMTTVTGWMCGSFAMR